MTCSSTYPCPLCLARAGLLEQTGDPRTWAQIIAFCTGWLTQGNEHPDTRRNYGCCHHMPIIGPANNSLVSDMIVPPSLHLELSMNKPLKNLADRWTDLNLWFKSINVEQFPYNGGNELGETQK